MNDIVKIKTKKKKENKILEYLFIQNSFQKTL